MPWHLTTPIGPVVRVRVGVRVRVRGAIYVRISTLRGLQFMTHLLSVGPEYVQHLGQLLTGVSLDLSVQAAASDMSPSRRGSAMLRGAQGAHHSPYTNV